MPNYISSYVSKSCYEKSNSKRNNININELRNYKMIRAFFDRSVFFSYHKFPDCK